MIKSLLTFLIVISFFVNTMSCFNNVNPLTKIEGIPENAFWAGGEDGGCWYLIKKIKKKKFKFKIYDNSGEFFFDGILCSMKNDYTEGDLKKMIDYYDGSENTVVIYLINNDELRKCRQKNM